MKQADQNNLYPVACKCFLVFNAVFDVEWSKTVLFSKDDYDISMMVYPS